MHSRMLDLKAGGTREGPATAQKSGFNLRPPKPRPSSREVLSFCADLFCVMNQRSAMSMGVVRQAVKRSAGNCGSLGSSSLAPHGLSTMQSRLAGPASRGADPPPLWRDDSTGCCRGKEQREAEAYKGEARPEGEKVIVRLPRVRLTAQPGVLTPLPCMYEPEAPPRPLPSCCPCPLPGGSVAAARPPPSSRARRWRGCPPSCAGRRC